MVIKRVWLRAYGALQQARECMSGTCRRRKKTAPKGGYQALPSWLRKGSRFQIRPINTDLAGSGSGGGVQYIDASIALTGYGRGQ